MTAPTGQVVRDLFRSRWAMVATIVALFATAVAYAPVFSFWWDKWLERDGYYSHTLFVPLASAALVILARRRLGSLPLKPSVLGLAIMAPAAIVAWVGRMSLTPSLMGLMFPFYLFGGVFAVLGWAAARALSFPIFFLLFMCVLPESITAALSSRMQAASIALSAALLNAVSIDAVAQGTRIHLPNTWVQVGEPCSGFRLVVSTFAVATFLAYIRSLPLWRRISIVALSVPLGLVTNTVRISSIATVGELWGGPAMVSVHDWTGWLVLFIAAAILLWLSKPSVAKGELAATAELGSPAPVIGRHRSYAAWVTAVALVFAFAALAFQPSARGRLIETFEDVPISIGGWTGADIDPGDSARSVPNSSVLMRVYQKPSGKRADLTIVYGLDPADLHRPEQYLASSGWATDSRKTVTIRAPGGDSHPARLLRLSQPGYPDLLCLYWFAGKEGRTAELASRKLSVFKTALLSGSKEPTALVTLTSLAGDDAALQEKPLLALAGLLDPHVTRMVSQPE
ncbi:MAG: EpsI family protein [Armatimonadetes bacterium]|nr:EpsI family protein [Armatimonadota bacterium]